jgi:epoxyqueuosine reductase
LGVDRIGFTNTDRLKNAPPSVDLNYVLPVTNSAVSLCVAYDKAAIRPYLSKQEQWTQDANHKFAYFKLKLAGNAIQKLLEDKGYQTAFPCMNTEYRMEQPFMAMIPPLSHKYVAIASGIGWFGWNGLILTPEYGATVVLATVVTSAELEPDEPMAPKDWCQNCRLCAQSCPTHYMSIEDEDSVSIAGHTYKYGKKRTKLRCVVCCGGGTGVNDNSDKWSTWCHHVLNLPGPEDDQAFENKVLEYAKDSDNIRLQ